MDICHAAESSRQQLNGMKGAKQVYAVNKERQQQHTTFPKQAKAKPAASAMTAATKRQQESLTQPVCEYCGKKHSPGPCRCPPFGKTCAKCGGKNHWAAVYARVEAQEGFVFWMQIPRKVDKSFW